MSEIIVTTANEVPGKKVAKVLGVVKGNTVRARNIGRDIFAGFKNLVGGEISEYTKLLDDSRSQALERMIEEAKKINADAIVGMRFTTSAVMQGCSEILAFGTAVKLNS